MTRKALGRGLDALLGQARPPEPAGQEELIPTQELAGETAAGTGLSNIPVDRIEPNPDQPRQLFDRDALQELADSIAAQGILQPLLVTETGRGGYYLIAGERRWQAAKLAGLTEVPCLIKEASPADRLALALIENIQRRDLNPLEEAAAYGRLINDYNLTQNEVAKAVGRDRATVANFVRLLKLPEPVQTDLVENRLSMGHARALLGLIDHQPTLLAARAKVLHRRLTVRQTERLVDQIKKPVKPRQPSLIQVQLEAEAEELRRRLGTKVSITQKGQRGRIVIEYFSDDELNRLLEWFKQG